LRIIDNVSNLWGDDLKNEMTAGSKVRIACARKFFEEIALLADKDRIKYDVVSDFSELMSAVRG
jgi:restriction endonuclease